MTEPATTAPGWYDIQPDLSAEPYVFAARTPNGPPPGVTRSRSSARTKASLCS
jgi:hypothetical protein